MPSTQTGAYTLADLRAQRFVSAAEFGLDTINDVLQADLDAHNQIMNDMISGFVEITTDQQRISGSSHDGNFVEVDEFGRSATQKSQPGQTVGFPLKGYQEAVGWTYKWLQSHTPAEMAEIQLKVQKDDRRNIQRRVKQALFGSANYAFVDYLERGITLNVKRLYNADSVSIPNGPNGETFDGSTHSHYNAAASLTTTALDATITDVIEHGHGGEIMIAINAADTATFQALTGFVSLTVPNIIAANTAAATLERLDTSRVDNRLIGYYKGYPVWTKVWVPASYTFVWDASDMPPVALRQRTGTTLQGLRLEGRIDLYPFRANYYEREFGVGVWNRSNGAILYFGGGTYVVPTFS